MTGTLQTRAALIGSPDGVLHDDQVTAFVAEQLAAQDLDGRSVCVIVPVVLPSTTWSSTAWTATDCGAFQFPGVNVSVAGDTVRRLLSGVTVIMTSAVG